MATEILQDVLYYYREAQLEPQYSMLIGRDDTTINDIRINGIAR